MSPGRPDDGFHLYAYRVYQAVCSVIRYHMIQSEPPY